MFLALDGVQASVSCKSFWACPVCGQDGEPPSVHHWHFPSGTKSERGPTGEVMPGACVFRWTCGHWPCLRGFTKGLPLIKLEIFKALGRPYSIKSPNSPFSPQSPERVPPLLDHTVLHLSRLLQPWLFRMAAWAVCSLLHV